MPFWSSQRIESEQAKRSLIDTASFDRKRIQQGSYGLSLSRDALITPNPSSDFDKVIGCVKEVLIIYVDSASENKGIDSTLTIPPGQFALVYTSERVTVPNYAISFISVKAKVKLKGLVNVSGFHVDPGFSGRLKFSLYNAGNRPICLKFGEPYFLIWFADLDEATNDPYDASHFHHAQSGLTTDDREQMSEGNHSPAALDQRLKHLEDRIKLLWGFATAILLVIVIPLLLSIFRLVLDRCWPAIPK